jgi:hypothetical protein
MNALFSTNDSFASLQSTTEVEQGITPALVVTTTQEVVTPAPVVMTSQEVVTPAPVVGATRVFVTPEGDFSDRGSSIPRPPLLSTAPLTHCPGTEGNLSLSSEIVGRC